MQYVPALTLLGFGPSQGPGPTHPVCQGHWRPRFDDVGAAFAAFTREPGSVIHLPRLQGPATIVVMCASWSGMLELRAGEECVVVDTYAAQHTLREIALPGAGVRDVSIRLASNRHPQSHDSELWLHRLVVQEHQPWLDRVVRLSPTLEVASGDFGDFVTLHGDVGISHAIRTRGAWGPEQVALFRALVRPGETVLDVGANIGHHTVALSRLVGTQGRVLAFEPQPYVYRVLQANLALNGCSNTDAFRLALGDSEGTAFMAPLDYAQGAWNVGGLGLSDTGRDPPGGTRTAVQVRRLDDLLGDAPVHFIKCDAEGFDLEVLKGAQRMLARCKPIILVEVAPLFMLGGPQNWLVLYDLLRQAGYVLIDPERPARRAQPRQWSGEHEVWDVLALQEGHFERLQAADPERD